MKNLNTMKIVKLKEKDIERLVRKIIKESPEFGNILGKTRMTDYTTFKGNELENYMFFQNLKDIKSNVDTILSMDELGVDKILSNGHDWASDHIATAKDDVEEVHHFLKHGDTIKEDTSDGFDLIKDLIKDSDIKIYVLKFTEYDGKYENNIDTKYFGDYDKAIKYLVDNGYKKNDWPVYNNEYEDWSKDYSLSAKLSTKTLEQ